MRAEDQFHVGIVVDDLDATLAQLSELFGYEWCDEIVVSTPVTFQPDPAPARTWPRLRRDRHVRMTTDTIVDQRFTYSRNTPRLEIIQSIPGTLWTPAAGSGIHHVGYWSDDIARDSAELERRGARRAAAGIRPDGTLFWAYHRSASGPRIELVSTVLQTALEQYWATGKTPSA